ncbi:MAG: hypothetical protein U9R20_03960 [Thermodesulfobacteriota bacterium]|nr:hypothetical protein [Thermodesulfobacteriota bacterium]
MTKEEFTSKLQSGSILDYEHRWDKGRIVFDLMPGQLLQLTGGLFIGVRLNKTDTNKINYRNGAAA